jgi:hypothetical protein
MNLHQMGAEKMPVKMPETFDSMRISSIFHNPSLTDSGNTLANTIESCSLFCDRLRD